MSRGPLTFDENGYASVSENDLLVHPNLPGAQLWMDLDRRGNWLKFRETLTGAKRTETRTVNGANEYETIKPVQALGAAIRNFAHDDAGNLLFNPLVRNVGDPCGRSPLDADCSDGSGCAPSQQDCNRGQEYEYDAESRLVRIRRDTNNAAGGIPDEPYPPIPEPILMEFTYDALGRRIETVEYVDAATGATLTDPRRTRHVYFGLEMIQEYGCGTGYAPCDTDPLLMREFIHGDPERYPEVVAMQTYAITLPAGIPPVSVPALVYHYLHDALGSVIGLVDEEGFLVERYTYDPYGKVFIEARDLMTGEMVPVSEPISGQPYSAFGNPFGFTGHVYLPAVGLVFAPERVYDPVLGRWLQRDPIEYTGGSLNLYEYVFSRPLAWIDPLGLDPVVIVIGNPGGGADELAQEITEDDPNTTLILNGNLRLLEQVLADPRTTEITIIGHGSGIETTKRTSDNKMSRWKGKWVFPWAPIDDCDPFIDNTDGPNPEIITPQDIKGVKKSPNLRCVDLYACHQGTRNRRKAWQEAFGENVKLKTYSGQVRAWLRWLFE